MPNKNLNPTTYVNMYHYMLVPVFTFNSNIQYWVIKQPISSRPIGLRPNWVRCPIIKLLFPKIVRIERYLNTGRILKNNIKTFKYPSTVKTGHMKLREKSGLFLKNIPPSCWRLSTSKRKMENYINRSFFGKGSPSMVKQALTFISYAKAYCKFGKRYLSPTLWFICDNYLNKSIYAYPENFLGVDCTGFVGNYLYDKYGNSINWQNSVDLIDESWYWYRGKNRTQVIDIKPDDVIVWGYNTANKVKCVHVAVVAESDGLGNLTIGESSGNIRLYNVKIVRKPAPIEKIYKQRVAFTTEPYRCTQTNRQYAWVVRIPGSGP